MILVIRVVHKGGFTRTERFFNKVLRRDYLRIIDEYGQRGVEALRAATPVDSGETANSWNYTIETYAQKTILYFTNSHVNEGVNIAIILNYGHGVNGGGFVQGRDFIDSAVQPIFDELANQAWKEVTS